MNRNTARDNRHYLVFTGHRIDTPNRATPRFPQRLEKQVAQLIKLTVQQELDRWGKHSADPLFCPPRQDSRRQYPL